MPQFPWWERQMAGWMDAGQIRQAQVHDAVSDLVTRAREATSAIPAGAVDLAQQARTRIEQMPGAVVGELRRHANLLDLATRHDVEAQSRLGRNRVSFVLQEFLEAQRGHEQELLQSLRSELREELASFAAAVDDNLFALDVQPGAIDPGSGRRAVGDLDYLMDDEDEDDDLDLVGYDTSAATDD
jgi:hypothetical protein